MYCRQQFLNKTNFDAFDNFSKAIVKQYRYESFYIFRYGTAYEKNSHGLKDFILNQLDITINCFIK